MARRSRTAFAVGVAALVAAGVLGLAWNAYATPDPGQPTPPAMGISDPKPGPEAKTGVGADALTTDEMTRARTLAVTPQLASEAKDVSGKAGPQFVMTELAGDATARTADVYLYDYAGDKLFKQVVDLKTGTLAQSFSAPGMQLPASRDEIDAALDQLLASPLAADLRTAYQKATGKPFTGKDGLTVSAHTFTAKPADTTVAQCGRHRCVTLVVQTADGPIIDVHEIVIDLSGRTVARLS